MKTIAAMAIVLSTTLNNMEMPKQTKPAITIHQEEINGDKVKQYELEKQKKKEEREKRKKEKFVNDLYWLSKIIHAENHDGSKQCRSYTGSVVLNRVKSKNYPNTIKEVIYQKGQYGCLNSRLWKQDSCKECKQIARELLENGSQLPSKVLYQAMFSQGKGLYAKVGTEYFCY